MGRRPAYEAVLCVGSYSASFIVMSPGAGAAGLAAAFFRLVGSSLSLFGPSVLKANTCCTVQTALCSLSSFMDCIYFSVLFFGLKGT